MYEWGTCKGCQRWGCIRKDLKKCMRCWLAEVKFGVAKNPPQQLNNNPRGFTTRRRAGAKRQIGDLMPLFGKEYVAFKGGEGGRGWSVNGTLVS